MLENPINTLYPINEVFQTIQGEGIFTGVPAIFIRLQGCPVGCPWCDTQHTWEQQPNDEVALSEVTEKTQATSHWANATAEQLVDLLKQKGYTAKHIVITGGEPAMFDLIELGQVLEQAGYQLQIETSGTFLLKVTDATWVTVSPKLDMPGGYMVRPDCMKRADEIKYPVAMQKHIDQFDRLLATCPPREGVSIALQPISQRPRATELAMKVCIERNWRLSVQLHKYLNIE
ncbi:7-carboxy-7-deazaguanine synthase QueE [Pseudidiomarina andamanensis]|uniref:7-carboxy-7-deazaguanine synthase n=1 Tax=Pseudidiomarina andamanensis TaxID=1940690 RepID=A0AA92ES35_9GAMM|nr:7-carboxy-7-deazaguanine synthase QueE [Pseudidiomarina andamanensis]MDS0219682.1 7-carboxy-7-deazaguanine synthase QueE [Pseudidiomarina andamanensis]QGT95697.1 7-carboxy-7-deazaguanine synthase QueE [Pseudidiomarina andamanensis]